MNLTGTAVRIGKLHPLICFISLFLLFLPFLLFFLLSSFSSSSLFSSSPSFRQSGAANPVRLAQSLDAIKAEFSTLREEAVELEKVR